MTTATHLHVEADALAVRARAERDPKRKRILEARAYVIRCAALRLAAAEQRRAA